MDAEHRRIHENMDFLGLTAPAIAAGLRQLTTELVRAGVLDEAAVDRIKDSIAHDLMCGRPRNAWRSDFESSIRRHLDALFEPRRQA